MRVSPHTHCESPLSGSTIAAMVDKAVHLGRTHFAYTDLGHLSSCLKTYSIAKKKGLKFIPGIEFYFKDTSCPYIAGTPAERCKYFTATLYCEDQAAYQELCQMISSSDFPTIEIYEEKQQLWGWKELEHMAKFNVCLALGGVHCMVGKTMLAGRPDLSEKLFLRIQDIFKDRLFVCLICETWTKKWNSVVEIELIDGSKVSCLASDFVSTEKARRMKAIDLIERPGHNILRSVSSGGISREVELVIKSAQLHKGFLPLPGGDALFKVNKILKALANKHNVPIIASDYAYYANKEDKIVQTMRLEGTNKLQPNFYMKSDEEMKTYLSSVIGLDESSIKHVFDNLDLFAERFSKLEFKYDWRLADTGESPLLQAMKIIRENGRMRWDDPKYVDRLSEELKVISKNPVKDLTPYFLPIRDVLNHYKDNGLLTGPGRGSAGGSLFCYLLGITQVNPFQYDLPFSRFFSMDRIMTRELPDIDVDLEERSLLVGEDGHSGYLYGRYGDRAAQVSTRTTIRLKSAIKDVNRYFKGKVEPEIEVFSKGLPPPPQGVNDHQFVFGYEPKDEDRIPGLIEVSEDLQKYIANRSQEWEIVSKAMGLTRAFSKHASAFVLSDIPIKDIVPIRDGYVTQYEAKECEVAGLIKYDYLVINQLKDIRICLDLINKRNKETNTVGYFSHNGTLTYIWNLPETQEVFQSVWGGACETIFQINTKSMVPFVIEILPQSIMDLATILALVRPGPMDFIDENTGRNMVQEYVLRRRGQSQPDIKELADLLPETFGILCIKAGSKVKTKEGLVNIESVLPGQMVQTENGTYQKVLNNIYKGISKTVKIRLDNSEELIVTPDHKVLTSRGWVEAKNLTNRDLVKHFWVSDKCIEEGNERDWLVGLILADGNVCSTSPSICAGDRIENANVIKTIADRAFGIKSKIYFHTRCWYVGLTAERRCANWNSNPVTAYLRALDIWGKTSETKKFPVKITKAMIEGFIDGDGNTTSGRIRIKNRFMAEQIFETLQGLRIKSSLFVDNGVDTITFDGSSFNFKIKKNVTNRKGIFYPKPEWVLSRNASERQYFFPKMKSRIPFISSAALDKIEKKYGLALNRNQTWSKVISVQQDAEYQVYDLSIENIHSFIVGGNVVHNCFQEQLNKIARNIAGFPGEKAEKLRKNMAKKKLKELMDMKPDFIAGAQKMVSIDTAEGIWDRMVTFGRYGFSIIHAVEYAMITYACMFLKHHYPLEWWAAVLTNADEQEITGILWPYVKDIVSPPDINLSSDIMAVDYANGKIRSKLGVIHGLGEATIGPIVAGRPYRDIQDFVNRDVAGPSLTNRLIHVGVLDSLFPPRVSLLEKLKMYADAVEINKFNEKLTKAAAEGKTIRVTGPKQGTIPEEYLNIPPMKDAAMKKTVLPSLPLDLYSLGLKHSKVRPQFETDRPIVISNRGYDTKLINGEGLKRLDAMDGDVVKKDIYVACLAYVVKSEEFSYPKKNPTKRALKLILDCGNGYINEKVLWPNYNTGELIYDKNLKRGCIATIFFKKQIQKKDLKIMDIIIES